MSKKYFNRDKKEIKLLLNLRKMLLIKMIFEYFYYFFFIVVFCNYINEVNVF